MKKVLPIVAAIVLILVAFTSRQENNYIIPKEAIRFRIIANSNSNYDQYIKSIVKKELEKDLKSTIKTNSIQSAKESIINNLSSYETTIRNIFNIKHYNQNFKINYGENHFPKKTYKGILYEEGNYESLVITIGEGKGDNWWCVLFPPLCSMEVDEKTDIEYRLYIKDTFEKYLIK